MREELKMKGRLPALVDEIVSSYGRTREINHIDCVALPDRDRVIEIIDIMFGILYPGYFGEKGIDDTSVEYHIGMEVESLHRLLFDQISRAITHECKRLGRVCTFCEDKAEEVAIDFISRIPSIREMLALDVQAAYDGDPAAKSLDEIIFSYPGMYAITVYRVAHELHVLGVPLIPRMMTERAHSITGIDIHPGATIGKSFFIDHGTGIVVGETTEIGDNVKIYQGVTLGALAPAKGQALRGVKRHPTIKDRATIYSGATILGGETVIGEGATIGGNVWVTRSVAPGARVIYQEPAVQRTTEAGKPKAT